MRKVPRSRCTNTKTSKIYGASVQGILNAGRQASIARMRGVYELAFGFHVWLPTSFPIVRFLDVMTRCFSYLHTMPPFHTHSVDRTSRNEKSRCPRRAGAWVDVAIPLREALSWRNGNEPMSLRQTRSFGKNRSWASAFLFIASCLWPRQTKATPASSPRMHFTYQPTLLMADHRSRLFPLLQLLPSFLRHLCLEWLANHAVCTFGCVFHVECVW